MPPERSELLQTDSPQTDGGSGPGGPTKPTHPQKPRLQRLSVASDSHKPPLLFKKKKKKLLIERQQFKPIRAKCLQLTDQLKFF